MRRSESGHVLQRDYRLSSGTAVVRVLRRFARSNTDSSAAAETRTVSGRTDIPRPGVRGNVKQDQQHQVEYAEVSAL